MNHARGSVALRRVCSWRWRLLRWRGRRVQGAVRRGRHGVGRRNDRLHRDRGKPADPRPPDRRGRERGGTQARRARPHRARPRRADGEHDHDHDRAGHDRAGHDRAGRDRDRDRDHERACAEARTGSIVPLYSLPSDPAWAALIAAKKAHPSVPVIAVINPNNGPGTAARSDYMNGDRAAHRRRREGGRYVATGYGKRPSPR